ncbi:MAG TPA: methyl-accepting chemotaxis protein [Bacillus bacterium]|nr:methyl-accepting chemotaxis protein [Bacillus sp. (in: firmicutes)]
MRRSLTWQLGIIIICIIFVSMIITSLSNYFVSYKKTTEAAGIEAVGCANITTGLVNPSDLLEAMRGNEEKTKMIENTINWTTEHKRLFDSHYILSLDGKILAADFNINQQGFKAGDKFYIDEKIVKRIIETKHPEYSSIYEFGGKKRLTGYAPIFKNHDPNQEIVALNAIDFDAKIVKERTWDSVKDSFALGLLPMIIACLITIYLIRRKTKPISQLIEYAKKIAEGDLSGSEIENKSKDEIGDLASALNFMFRNLRELICQIRSSTEMVASSANHLTAISEQSNYATKQITETMKEVASGVDKQTKNIEQTSKTVHDVSIGVDQIKNNAESVSYMAMEASDKATDGGQSIHNAVKQMNLVNQTFNGLADMVQGLGERSKEIGQIIEVITGIADQTNLLALNAAIEAARAGEHGRGFSVVAEEVRKLAEQSAHSAQEISRLISTIMEETKQVVQSMEVATHEVNYGIEVVNTAGNSFVSIEHSVNDVTTQIQEVTAAVQHMAVDAEQIVRSVEFIAEIAGETASGTREVAASSADQLSSVEGISSSAVALETMAKELQQLLSKFKV